MTTAGQSTMELTRFDVITGKGRSKEGVGNENYKALVEENKVRRLVATSPRRLVEPARYLGYT